MSIEIAQPSMALNSDDVPGVHYRMWNTWEVAADKTADDILGWTAKVAGAAKDGYLRSVIINCHGYYSGSDSRSDTGGYGLKIGTGIRRADTTKFSVLKGKVACIWITACGTARISATDASGNGDGNLFCSEIAKNSGAYVIAATTHQVGDLYLRANRIDDFEGLVLRYTPQGGVDWSHDYGRGILDGVFNGWN